MDEIYKNWSLDNWPEPCIHDDWDEATRRLSQQAIGHDAIFLFFQEIPELNFLVPYLFKKGNVTCSFFGAELAFIMRTLSGLSKGDNECLANTSQKILEKIIKFIEKCYEFRESNLALYCVGLEIVEGFYLVGDERESITSMLGNNLKKSIRITEKAMGIPESYNRIENYHKPIMDLVVQEITTLCKKSREI